MLDARVGDDHVETAEPVEAFAYCGLVGAGVGQIGFERRPWAVGIGTKVDGEHVHPVGLEALGDGATDPARRARDQRRLAL